MLKKERPKKVYYFSDKLKRKLARIPYHPLTIVEAPSGFGKTTAIREYLKENLPQGACEYWYTCLGEPASMAWMGICELFSNVNVKVADDLKNLKMPTMDTLFYMTAYLRGAHCQTETYLVVDNYQLVNCDIPHELISVFSMHGNSNLHMIFITQQLEAKQQISIHNEDIYTIDASSFFFDREGTSSLFRMEGIRLTEEELEKIFMSTDGWVSAIRLQVINFIETGSFAFNTDIEKLVETAIWNKLTPEEKDFLLSVSVLDSFTARQAAIMMNQDAMPENIGELLRNNDFIRYLPDKSLYSMHSILQDYLRNRFYHLQSEDYQIKIFRKAGASCAALSQYYPASEFFYKIRDFDAILSLPFSREYLDRQREKYQSAFLVTIVNECPEEILCKYPLTMIIFGYYTLMNGQEGAYQKLCKLLLFVIQNETDFGQEELRRIRGEYTLLAALGDFNDITKMIKGHEKAFEILGKPSVMINSNTPWLFATNSVLNMFWRESGVLESQLDQIDRSAGLYYKLAQGHGIGYNIIMRAEAMLMRGEDDEAEILCHKALCEARSYRQVSMCLCAELILARIAILRGDVESYFTAIKNIQGYTEEHSEVYVLRKVEHSMSVISLLLGVKDYVAPWLYDMESIKKVLYAPIVPFAQILHLNLLLMDKRYNEFYGVCQLALDTSKNPTGNIKYRMPLVHQLIFLAIAKRNNGNDPEAQKYLREALDAALPDQIYLPFAQQECMEDFLSELNIHSFDSGGNNSALYTEVAQNRDTAAADRNGVNGHFGGVSGGFAALIALCKRQQKGVSMIRKAIFQDKSPLTPREREIAQLTRERFSAREVADKLYISEMTVRATLRNVYSKLDIHSKTELSLKEF